MTNHVQNFYDTNAPIFDDEQEEFAFVRIPEKKIVLDTLDKILTPEQTVLEIGAGTGRFTLKIAPRVNHVTAVDISQNMLDRLTVKMKDNGIENIDRIHGSFMDIDFKDQFDLIVSFSVIEYINDKDALFEKIAHLLKPGGILLFTTAHNTFFRFWGRFGNYFRQKVFMGAFSKRKIRRLLTVNGLQILRLEDLCLKSLFTGGILLFVHASK